MDQPISGWSFSRVSATAAATATLVNGYGILHNVVIPANKTGTITFYDSASGTNSSLITTIPNTVGTIPTNVIIDARVKNGLTYTSGGTTDVTIVYD